MTWPTVAVPTTGMDSDTDSLPRADIKQLTDTVNAIMAMLGQPGGPCELDGGGLVPVARLPAVRIHEIGEVFAYAGPGTLPGTMFAAGQAVSRATYAVLFSRIGTSHGSGDGVTTFNLPDLRGRVIMGCDGQGGTAANRVTAGISGMNAAVLGAVGGDQVMMTHTHTGTTSPDGAHTHTYNQAANAGNVGGGGFPQYFEHNVSANTGSAGSHNHTFTTGATGGGSSQNIQPSIAMVMLIQVS